MTKENERSLHWWTIYWTPAVDIKVAMLDGN